jgi:hypothetical protein
MKRFILAVPLLIWSSAAFAASGLFPAGESKWTVTSGKTAVGKAVVRTDGTKVRVDWTPASGTAASFVAADGKLWVKGTPNDSEFSSIKGATEKIVIPALLAPTVTAKADKVTRDAKGITAYTYGPSTAKYTYDAKGPQSIAVTSGGQSYALTRDSISTAVPAATLFAINQKESRLKGLTKMAGNALAGPSDSSVGASAGVTGVGEGTKLDSVGDYDQLAALEAADEARQKTLSSDLKKFQKEGKVGKAGGAQ